MNITDTIGTFECTTCPHSLFAAGGSLIYGSKATLVTTLKAETGIQVGASLPTDGLKTSVIVDAIQRWSFLKDETFDQVQRRHRRNLLAYV
jgi:hypothetical protein